MEKRLCLHCGTPINNSEYIYCENCGKLNYEYGNGDSNSSRIYSSPYGSRVESNYEKIKYRKNKYIAFFLSIFTGLGQIYNGQILKGILMPVLLYICFVLIGNYINNDIIFWPSFLMFFVVYFYSFADAYKTANKINENNGNYFYSKDEGHTGFYEDNSSSFQKFDVQISSYFHDETYNGEKTVSLTKTTILMVILYTSLFFSFAFF